jgi:hypothetical protein
MEDIDEEYYNTIIITRDPKRHYWQYLIAIGVFIFLPVAQFTLFQEEYDDYICYYNNKCIHRFMGIKPFNNIISNILYIIFGIIFILTVRFSKIAKPGCGTNQDKSLYYSVGICLIFIGLFSGLFHICPSPLNFQFDTLYMFVGGALTFLAIYHKRHMSKIPSAFKTYLFLAFFYYLNTISLIKYSQGGIGLWLWLVADFFIVYILVHGTINLYYANNYALSCGLFNKIKETILNWRFINKPKFVLVCIINIASICLIFDATFSRAIIFTDWFLALFIMNMAIYFVYYIIQKVIHDERIMFYIWVMIFIDIICIGIALLFYSKAISNKFLTHQESDALNEPCVLFGYFDYHDIWHFLSAIGLYMFINTIYFIDNDLSDTPRSSIPVF